MRQGQECHSTAKGLLVPRLRSTHVVHEHSIECDGKTQQMISQCLTGCDPPWAAVQLVAIQVLGRKQLQGPNVSYETNSR